MNEGPQGTLQLQKRELRREMLQKRRHLDSTVIAAESEKIFLHLINSMLFKKSKCIMIYLAMPDEVQTMAIVQYALKAQKEVCVPYITDKIGSMEAVRLKNLNDLEYGKFNILSVKSSKIYSIEPTDIDLVITPGVAFDVEGNRLGMGAGFYDIFFSRTSYVKTVGLSLSCQLIDSVPSMNHDYKLNYILIKDGIINCKTGKM